MKTADSEEVIGLRQRGLERSDFLQDTTFLWTSANSDGCTAEVSLDLTVHPSHDLEDFVELRPHRGKAKPRCSSGAFIFSTVTEFGCDSVTTIDFTLLATDFLRDCRDCLRQLHLERQHVREHGRVQLVNERMGCDSTAVLNLTIVPSYELPEASRVSLHAD